MFYPKKGMPSILDREGAARQHFGSSEFVSAVDQLAPRIRSAPAIKLCSLARSCSYPCHVLRVVIIHAGNMRSLSRSGRTRFPVGLLLLATAAPLLNVALADIVTVGPGELQTALDNVSVFTMTPPSLVLLKTEFKSLHLTVFENLLTSYLC